MASLFLNTLREAELDAYYGSLTAYGVRSVEALMQLTMQDYGVVGVHSMEDRKRLYENEFRCWRPHNPPPLFKLLIIIIIILCRFQLIQTLKSDFPNDSSSAAVASNQTSSKPAAVAIPIKRTTQPTAVNSNSTTSLLKPGSAASTHHHQLQPLNHANAFMSSRSLDMNGVGSEEQQQQLGAMRVSRSHDKPNNSRYSNGNGENTDDDPEDSPPGYRKLGRSVPNNMGSPKQTRSNLNAYGVPNSFPTAIPNTQKKTSAGDLTDRIRVCVRKRPLNKKELKRGETDIARVTGRRSISILEPKVKVDLTKFVENHEFMFDEAFDIDATNDEVYKRTAAPLVEYIFDGGKATCFAYGQTGSGKTFTMLDSTDGLYVKAGRDIFNLLRQPQHAHLSAWVSFYEIYQGQLYDLLGNRRKLYAREDGKQQVIIKDIQEYEVDKVDRLMQIFEAGNATRSTGATGANADSSRSHAIFQILLKQKGKKEKIVGKLSFIDLAGSERGADRGETDKQTRMEGSEINKSLLALKECIRALDQDSRHTPFRQSKLTQVLKDSFIGNSRTCMIATITPNMSNSEHSLNTLRYADRVKELKGATSYDSGDDEEFPNDDAVMDYDDEEENLLLDDEFPPEAFQSDHHMEDDSDDPPEHLPASLPKSSSASARSSLLAQVNKRPLLPRLNPSDSHGSSSSRSNSNESIDLKGMATALNPRSSGVSSVHDSSSLLEDLIKLHRSHIRDSTDSGKIESKLLVNLTMKMGKISGDRSAMHLTFDNYVRELDEIVKTKMASLIDLQAKINQHLSN